MASSTDSDCHKDPNFAVICSFIDKYGEFLGLPHVSYLDLETYLQDTTNNVSRVLVDIHVRLLRRIGKSSVSSDRFEKSIIKFCHHFSEFDAWEVESYGYKHANIKTKLRILKNLLESQFDYNLKFKEKVNENNAEEMRFLPIGRDKEGQAYWYFLDKDLNLLIYKEEQDDEDADTWQLVCSDRQQLEKLVKSLKIDGGEEVKEEDDKNSSESRSSKEGSPDSNEIDLKKENAGGDAKKEALKQEPDSIVKEEPVERDKVIVGDSSAAIKTESTESDSISKKQNGPTGCGGKFEKGGDAKLGCKVELNVSIERLSEESVEKYKKRKEDEKPREKQDRVSQSAVRTGQAPPEASENGNTAQDVPEENGIIVNKGERATPSDEDQQTSLKDGGDGKGDDENVSKETEKENEEEIKAADCSEKGARGSSLPESKTAKSSKTEVSTDLKSAVSEQDGETAVISASKEDSFPETGEEGCDKDGAKGQVEAQIKDKARHEKISSEEEEEEEKGKDDEKKENVKPTEPDKDISADNSGKLKSETAEKEHAQITSNDDTPSKSVVCDSDKMTEKPTSDVAEHEDKQRNSNDVKESDSDKSVAKEKTEQPAEKKVETALISEQESDISEEKSQKSLETMSDPQVSNELKEIPEKLSSETPQKAEGTDISPKLVVEEESNACQEKRKAEEGESASENQPDASSPVSEKCSEGTEKASDAKPASEDVNAASMLDKGLADEEKTGEDNACADPGQSQLLKDPDRDKTKVADMGAAEDGNEKKSPADISDAEENFAETADDHEVDDESTGDKVPQSDDKEAVPACRTDGEASSRVFESCDEVKSRGGEEPDVPSKGFSEVKKGAEVSGGLPPGDGQHDGVESSGNGQKKCSEVDESSVGDCCGEDGQNATKSSMDGPEKCGKDDKLDIADNSDQGRQKCGESGQESGQENVEETPKSNSSSSVAVEESKESSKVEKVEPKKEEIKSKEEGSESHCQANSSASSGAKTGTVSEEGVAVNETAQKSLEDEKCDDGKDDQESGDTLKSSAGDKREEISVQDSDNSLIKPKQSGADVEKSIDDSKSGEIQTGDAKSHSPKPSVTEDGEKSVKSDETLADEEKSSASPKASLPESTDEKPALQKDLKDEDKPKVAIEESENKGEKLCDSGGQQDKGTLKESEKPNEGNEKEVPEASSVSEAERAAGDDVKDLGKGEKQQDKQSAAHAVPPTDDTSETSKPLEGQNTKNNVDKESEEKTETAEGNESRDESHDQTTAEVETEIKECSKEDKVSSAKTPEGEKNEPPGKRTRGSETQRNLKRAAPEPASDDVVESEPNGKRARPTARVQKTRGGRDAAARGRVTRLANKDSESEDSESVVPVKSRRGCGRGRGRGGSRGRGRSRDTSASKIEEAQVKKADGDDNEEDVSDQANGKRAKKKKPDSSSEALSEEEVTPAKKGRNQIQTKNAARGAPAARGNRRGGRGGAKGAAAKKAAQTPAPAAKGEDSSSRRRSARVKEMKARRPPTPSSPEEESEPTEEDDDDEEGAEEDYNPEKFFLEASFTPEEESGDEEFKPKGRNFQRQAARTTKEKNEEMVNDDTPCVKCGKYNHPEMILLCDKCDAGYHTACLRPPLMVIPDGDWFCPPCEHSMLVEKLFACLQSLDLALKKKDRLSKRQERLAYVGISINNILHGGRPCQVSEKFGRKPGDAQSGEEPPEEEVENVPSEGSSSYDSEDEAPERQFRSARLAMRQAEKRSRREHKRRKPSRAQSPDIEVFAKRTCRTRSSVSYQFKEFDELISNAIDDDQPIRKEKPPGRSRGKDMSNILGASDEEDEKIRQRDGLEPVEIPVVKRKPKRRLTRLDDSEEEDVDDESEEFKISEDSDSDATEVEEENGDGDEDGLSEEESDSGDWKPKKTWYNSRNNRSNRRKKFVVEDDDEYESDENASKRRSTRNSTRGRIKYDDWDSEEEEETEETEEEEASFSDFSSDDSRFARKMRKEREKRKSKGGHKEGKKKSKRNADDDDEGESDGSVSDSSMVRKRKMLMKLVKKRRKDASGNEDSEEAEISKSRIKSRKAKRKAYSDDDSSATVDEDESDEEESNEPRMKKKNVLRSSDEEEEEVEKLTAKETVTKAEEAAIAGNSTPTELEATKSQLSEEPPIKAAGKRESPTKAAGKGKKRGDAMNLKTEGIDEVKDGPVPGKVRRVSGSDKEGAAEPNPLLKTASPPKKVLPSRRARGASTEGPGEMSPEKKIGTAAGNRRSSTEKLTRSGKKKKLPNFLDVPSGGESDEGEVKPPADDTSSTPVSKPDQLMSSAQQMHLGAQPHMGPGFPPQQNQGPQPPGFLPNQRFGNPQGHQFNPAFAHHGQMGPPHLRPGLSSPPHSMANVSSTGGHEEATAMAQMPPHYSAPPGHPGNSGLTAANMRGPYPRYNGMPPQMPPQGMPQHMMNQALEPGQIPPSMSQQPHGRHPHPLPPQQQQQPPHGMGHDQAQAGMMQQWPDQRGPGQPPGYGNAPRMPYPRDMVPRQPYYHHHHHMRSPPPHGMGGQYPPNMASSMNNPLTSMGQMTRNLSQGMKSSPPRPVGEAGGEDGGKAAAAPQDMQVKLEVKQEMAEKEREAETATPEKKAGKAGGKRAKASSPKSQPERAEGEEPAGNKGQVSQAGNTVPPSSMPSSTAPLPPYQPHPYMNSQQGFYMSQQYRMQYGGPNQGPMNQMRGVLPPHHNPYMTPNHPFPGQQGHRPYLPAGQQQTGMPPNMPPNMPPISVSGQTTLPPSTMPGGQQSQPDTTPHQQMASSGMPPNPNFPVNQQRPPPMNAGHQGLPDSNNMMVPPGGYPQRPPGMPPSQAGGPPGMMPNMRPPIMAHQVGPPAGMQLGPAGPHTGPHGQTGPPHGAQGKPGAPGQGQPPQGAAGVPQQTQQPPMNVRPHSQGSQSASPASSQGEPAPTMRGPQMGPYHPMTQPGAPSQPAPPAESRGGQQAEGESLKSKSEPQAAAASPSSSSGANKTQESDAAAQEQKTAVAADKPVKEEPKPAQQDEKPQGSETVPTQSGPATQPGTAGGSNMPMSQSGDPNTAVSSANNRNFPPPGSMNQVHPSGQGGPPMPYYNPGPYYHPYSNMPPQGQHMHPQARWGQNMPPYGPPRFGGHGYPPYGMGPEAMNMNMMPGQQGMHGNAGAPPPPHPQGNPNAGPAGTPPHSAVPSTPPHPGAPSQDFQAPRDQPAAVRNRRSSSTDSRPGVPTTAAANSQPEGQLEPVNSNNSSQPQLSPTVSSPSYSPSTSVKSEHLPTVSSPSSVSQSSSSTATTASTPSVSQQPPVPTSSPKSMPSKPAATSGSDFQPETPGGAPVASPAMSVGLQSTWSGPSMNHQYSRAMSHMQRMGHPGAYNAMPPYGPQGMMPPQSHNPYMMGPNPRHANSQGQGQGNFDQYPGGHMALPHGMGPMQGLNQPPMSYNDGYRPPYMPPHPQGHDHLTMPPRPDFGSPEGQSGSNAPEMGGRANESRPPPQIPPPSDSPTNEGNAVTAPKAKRAKTQKKKDVNSAGSSPRGKGSRGRGRGRGGFMIDSLLQARGVGKEEEEGEDSGEMKDIVNYVITDEYIKQQTSS